MRKQKVKRVGTSAVNYVSNDPLMNMLNLNLMIISFIISTYYVVIHKKNSEQRQYV